MRKNLYNLTNPQNFILITEQFYKGTNINNICGSLTINQLVNFNKFKEAINIFVKNDDSFKTKLVLQENCVKQYFSDYKAFNIDIVDINSDNDLEQLKKDITSIHFDVFNEPLFRFTLFRLNNGYGGFIINVHHLISDSWGLNLITQSIVKIYNSLINSSDAVDFSNISYINYIEAEQKYLNSDKFLKDKEYWNEIFNTVPDIVSIPNDIENYDNSLSYRAKRKILSIDNNFVNSINTFCSDHKISTFNFFMAIVSTYLWKINGINEFVIGTPILNRSNYQEKNTTGLFINIVPFKISIDNNYSFNEFLAYISKSSLNMLRHQKYSYQCILDDIRKNNTSLSSLYNILLSYQITKAQEVEGISYDIDWNFNENLADDLEIHLYDLNDEKSLNIAYDYKVSKYSDKLIEDMHNRIIHIMKQVLDNNNIFMKDLEIITPEEKNYLVDILNNTKSNYDKDLNIIKMFEEQVLLRANELAVSAGDNSLTYKELNNQANYLANELLKKGVKSGSIIALMLDRTEKIIVTILAILKVGATYMPIDPAYPDDRIDFMLKNSEASLIIATRGLAKKCNFSNIIFIDELNFSSSSQYNNPNILINSNFLAYIMYTSGSTGTPKAVCIKHFNVINYVKSVQKILDYTPNNSVLSVTTMCFDIFVFEVFPTLLSGLHLVIANEEQSKNPGLLNSLIIDKKISKLLTTPSRVQLLFLDSKYLNCLSVLKEIALGGEPFPKDLLLKLKVLTNAKIYNFYGPTETTVYSTYKNLTQTDIITIGKPIDNTRSVYSERK